MRNPSYLKFKDNPNRARMRRTRCIDVIAIRGNNLIGRIEWYPAWRQYAFFPENNTIWNPDCLNAISTKCFNLTAMHREALQMAHNNGE